MKKDLFDREIDRGDLVVIAEGSVVRIGIVEKVDSSVQYWPIGDPGLKALIARRSRQKVISSWTNHLGVTNTYSYYPKVSYVQYTYNHRFLKITPEALSVESRVIYEEMKKVF